MMDIKSHPSFKGGTEEPRGGKRVLGGLDMRAKLR